MELKNAFSVIAGLLSIIGFLPYILAIFRKETQPSKASWIIWAVLDTVTFAAMYASKTVNGHIIGSTCGAWIIAGLTFRYGSPGWTKLDIFCLGGAMLGIVLWKLFHNPSLGIVTSLIVLSLGSVPTLMSAWHDPSHENKLAWTIFWLSGFYALIAIPRLTLEDAAQPITFFTLESMILFILFFRPKIIASSQQR